MVIVLVMVMVMVTVMVIVMVIVLVMVMVLHDVSLDGEYDGCGDCEKSVTVTSCVGWGRQAVPSFGGHFLQPVYDDNHDYNKDDNDDDDDDDNDHRVGLFLQNASPQKLTRAGSPKPHWDVKESATKFGI